MMIIIMCVCVCFQPVRDSGEWGGGASEGEGLGSRSGDRYGRKECRLCGGGHWHGGGNSRYVTPAAQMVIVIVIFYILIFKTCFIVNEVCVTDGLQVSPLRVLLRRRSSAMIKATGHVTFDTGRLNQVTMRYTSSVTTKTSRTARSWLTSCQPPMTSSRRTWEQNCPTFKKQLNRYFIQKNLMCWFPVLIRWDVMDRVWSRSAASSTNLQISPSIPMELAEESWSSTLRWEPIQESLFVTIRWKYSNHYWSTNSVLQASLHRGSWRF